MKLRDLFISMLSETTLFEMAYAKKDAWRIVQGLAVPLSLHIIKILTIPNSKDIPHWKKEINVWLADLNSIILKPENKRLSLQIYWDWLVAGPEIDAVDIIRHLRVQYKDQKFVVSSTLQQDFQNSMRLICNLLAANEPIDIDEVLGLKV